MRKWMLAIPISLLITQTFAQETSCAAQASNKNLAGAALKSFMSKCEREAKATCEVCATERKLAGAAKASFSKKCLTDAVGKS